MHLLSFVAIAITFAAGTHLDAGNKNGRCPPKFHAFVMSEVTGRPELVKTTANGESKNIEIKDWQTVSSSWEVAIGENIKSPEHVVKATDVKEAYEREHGRLNREIFSEVMAHKYVLPPGLRVIRSFFPRYQISYGVLQKFTEVWDYTSGRFDFVECKLVGEASAFVRNPITRNNEWMSGINDLRYY